MPKRTALGLCYPWAYSYVQKHKDAVMVHGTVEEPFAVPPHRYEHAWVEHHGLVKDWQTIESIRGGKFRGVGYPREIFYELFKPLDMRTYTADEAIDVALACVPQHGRIHVGPWHGPGSLPPRRTRRRR